MSLEIYIAAFLTKITAAGLTVSGEKKLDYGRQLILSNGTDKITANIYNGKKGISVVVGGSAGSPLKEQLLAIVEGRTPSQAPVPTNGAPPGFEHIQDFDNCWIGTDESGKGDFFGPLVVAAVRVDNTTASSLQSIGVKDSKSLTDVKAKALAARIREMCAGSFVELEMMPARYNALYNQLRSEGKNLNHLLAWGHARVLEDLLQKAPCRFALADKFANEKFILSRLMDKGRQITLVQTTKAERNVAVAAASVLARDRFLARMEELAGKYGMVFPKGASQLVVEAAGVYAARFGKTALVEVAKIHFKTIDQI